MERLIVTLDGPAGSGKSSVARQLAQRLGVAFLDTGAMYRGLTAGALDRGIHPAEQLEQVAQLARDEPVRFDFCHDPPRLHLGDRDVTDRLRDADVTQYVSDVAAHREVRQVLVEAQRAIGREHPRLVTEGRDQGSVVFPRATVKFYLDARPEVRAERRAKQLQEAGREADVEAIRLAIIARDHRDSTRADGPLVCPNDAQRIDTSGLTQDEVVALLETRVREAVEATS
ncbi:MAG: (d)CMP kinase [Phycisphaeraceae bacterium]